MLVINQLMQKGSGPKSLQQLDPMDQKLPLSWTSVTKVIWPDAYQSQMQTRSHFCHRRLNPDHLKYKDESKSIKKIKERRALMPTSLKGDSWQVTLKHKMQIFPDYDSMKISSFFLPRSLSWCCRYLIQKVHIFFYHLHNMFTAFLYLLFSPAIPWSQLFYLPFFFQNSKSFVKSQINS